MGTDREIGGIPDNLILFDGVCNLCNSSVNFVIDRDRQAQFSFASLQSEVGAALLASQGMSNENLESVMLWKGGVLYKKSRAALEISRQLSGAWPLLYVFRIVPAFLRDLIYDFIANRRYKWFGRRDQCRIPEPGLKKRFVETVSA
jgi:predicted DCC family thiol-disulfide oxidoreductase YuxK